MTDFWNDIEGTKAVGEDILIAHKIKSSSLRTIPLLLQCLQKATFGHTFDSVRYQLTPSFQLSNGGMHMCERTCIFLDRLSGLTAQAFINEISVPKYILIARDRRHKNSNNQTILIIFPGCSLDCSLHHHIMQITHGMLPFSWAMPSLLFISFITWSYYTWQVWRARPPH